MPALEELFEAAKRSGIGVLVINELHIGDKISAAKIVGGDENTTTTTNNTLSIPREVLQGASQSRALSSASFGEGGPCKPLAPEMHDGRLWDWRIKENNEAASKWQQEYAKQCDEHWSNR